MALVFVGVPPTTAAAEDKRPNVVLILADKDGARHALLEARACSRHGSG
jgi:hypothetical protein